MIHTNLKNLLDVAIEAAYLAGRRTLAYFNAGVEVEIKQDETPVTRADRESEELIRKIIGRHFPDHAILGEEYGDTRGNAKYRWIVDPIDGTKSFIRGVPFYGTMIGIEVDGVPRIGVIYLPALDEMVYAASGHGAFWNGRKAQVSTVNSLADAAILTSDEKMSRDRSDAYERILSEAKFSRSWGDCYGYVLVATGRAEVMLDPVMKSWDCAPCLPIIQEAGGVCTDWKGNATIHSGELIASNPSLHPKVLEILKTERKQLA
jgi:histidinol phosphatase-like enzyme (inositol monophosphatase family)